MPLQIHPNKDLATRPHHKDPEKFTDDNHKPEIAVALGKFGVFGGWKSNNDIESLFNTLERLKKFLPDQHVPFDNDALKRTCQSILEASDEVIRETQEKLGKLTKESFGNQSYMLDLSLVCKASTLRRTPGISSPCCNAPITITLNLLQPANY